WPEIIMYSLACVDPAAEQQAYFPGWAGLLTDLFPSNQAFGLGVDRNRTPDRTGIVIIFKTKPIFFVELKIRAHLGDAVLREVADKQMRGRLEEFYDGLNPMYGISAFGTRFSIYSKSASNNEIIPTNDATDPAPLDRWNLNILAAQGEFQIRTLAARIRR
ncbi:hypothetical protein C8R43DRAFT_853335, partial [Mycena crocata]